MKERSYTWQEIVSQPEVWEATLAAFDARRDALQQFLDQAAPDEALFVGCGSTHYLARAAAAAWAHTTLSAAWAAPASELLLFPEALPARKPLLVAVSRSGATTETVWAIERFRKVWERPVLAVTCYADSPVARQADFILDTPAAQEQSIAQTRSFVSMFILTQLLAATSGQDEGILAKLRELPDALRALSDRLGDLPRLLGADLELERYFFLGAGPLYGLACEAMLKMKEMTLSYAEAYHPLEFRHGPMSMVNAKTLVVGLVSDAGAAQEVRVLRDMQRLGARTLALVENASVFDEWRPDHVLELRSGLDEWTRGALYLPPLQRMAHYRAEAKGLNPDAPANLAAVVEL